MQLLSNAAMTYLRNLADKGFMDTCQRLVHTAGTGDYGYGTPTYPEGASMACLFKPRAVTDAQEESAVPMADADLYLPRGTTLLPADRVKITHLHGDAVASPQTFDIVGGPVLGKTLIHAELKLVTDGSDEVEEQ